MKRWISLVAVIIVIAGIFYLTFQNPAETGALTETVLGLLLKIGIHVATKPLRHYIHYVMYFILEFVVCEFCRSRGWSVWIGVVIGCGIGLLDEGVKVLLPTREFDVTDLLRDFVGVAVAMLIEHLIDRKNIKCWKE